jgi:hypothetical protein
MEHNDTWLDGTQPNGLNFDKSAAIFPSRMGPVTGIIKIV